MIISFHYFRSLLIATCFFAFTHPAMGATFVSEYGAYNSANSVYLEFPAGGGYPSSVWAPTETGVSYYNGICNAVTEQTVWSVSDGLAVSEIKDIAADPTCSFWGGPSAVGSDVTCKVLVGDNGITFYKSRNNATEVNPTFYTIRPSLLTLTSQQGFPVDEVTQVEQVEATSLGIDQWWFATDGGGILACDASSRLRGDRTFSCATAH